MKLARMLGLIGRGLISAGTIVLLFVAYQLWGTGLQHSAAQGSLGDAFQESTGIEVSSDAESLAAAARASQAAIEQGQLRVSTADLQDTTSQNEPADTGGAAASTESSGDTGTEPAPATETQDPASLIGADLDASERQEILAKLYPEAGEAFARIVIPDIGVDQITVAGVSVEDLRKGPGHYTSTANPGNAGNAGIAGHRTTYGAPFHRIDELQPNDPIFVTTAQGVFEYRVLGFANPDGGDDLGYFIVSPSDTWVLDQKPGQNILTLTACHPKYSARQRIIVQAELVGEPAPTIPRDEAADFEPINLDSGAVDERAAEPEGVRAGIEIPEEERQILSDAVAADDDPSVDADGNPLADAAPQDQVDASVGSEVGDSVANADESSAADEADFAEVEEAVTLSSEDIELTASQTPLRSDDFGEGLNGDPTKVKPAIMWGLAGLSIWFAASFIGGRLDRKWTVYFVAVMPFAVVLWSTFVNIDQALPSY